MTLPDLQKVADVIRQVAQTEILPRFQTMKTHEIREKSPGALVTEADIAAEKALMEGLAALLPGATFVGEEAAADDPSILERLAGRQPVWVLDPVDGTRNFAEGRRKFAVIVALVIEGQTQAGWIYDPLTQALALGQVGRGCWVDDQRARIARDKSLAKMAGSLGYRRNRQLAETVSKLVRQGSVAHDYLGLLRGEIDFAYFRKLHPWDHAAGVLLHQEAGGYSALMDKRPYRPIAGQREILIAPSEPAWDQLKPLVEAPL